MTSITFNRSRVAVDSMWKPSFSTPSFVASTALIIGLFLITPVKRSASYVNQRLAQPYILVMDTALQQHQSGPIAHESLPTTLQIVRSQDRNLERQLVVYCIIYMVFLPILAFHYGTAVFEPDQSVSEH